MLQGAGRSPNYRKLQRAHGAPEATCRLADLPETACIISLGGNKLSFNYVLNSQAGQEWTG